MNLFAQLSPEDLEPFSWKHHPIVPENAHYGVILLAICVAIIIFIRLIKRD